MAKEADAAKVEGKKAGLITHFFDHINVAVVELSRIVKKGDRIRVKGCTTDFEQEVGEMQVDHAQVEKAKKGDAIGMKVSEKVRKHDVVYLI